MIMQKEFHAEALKSQVPFQAAVLWLKSKKKKEKKEGTKEKKRTSKESSPKPHLPSLSLWFLYSPFHHLSNPLLKSRTFPNCDSNENLQICTLECASQSPTLEFLALGSGGHMWEGESANRLPSLVQQRKCKCNPGAGKAMVALPREPLQCREVALESQRRPPGRAAPDKSVRKARRG